MERQGGGPVYRIPGPQLELDRFTPGRETRTAGVAYYNTSMNRADRFSADLRRQNHRVSNVNLCSAADSSYT